MLLLFSNKTLEKLTRSFEAVSNAAGPAYVMDEGTEHMAPEVIWAVLTFFVYQPEPTSDDLLHQCHPCPAQIVLIHHLYTHRLLEGELHVLMYLQWKMVNRFKTNLSRPPTRMNRAQTMCSTLIKISYWLALFQRCQHVWVSPWNWSQVAVF